MFGTLVLRTRAQTEMYPSCFALVIILKFNPCRDRIIIFCPSGVGCTAHITYGDLSQKSLNKVCFYQFMELNDVNIWLSSSFDSSLTQHDNSYHSRLYLKCSQSVLMISLLFDHRSGSCALWFWYYISTVLHPGPHLSQMVKLRPITSTVRICITKKIRQFGVAHEI